MITVCVRFDCVKYSGEHEAGDDSDDDGDNRVTYSLGIAMLVFRIRSPAFGTGEGEGFRDFCFCGLGRSRLAWVDLCSMANWPSSTEQPRPAASDQGRRVVW